MLRSNETETMMAWLQGEPALEDLLSDPTIRLLMERDDVDPDDLRTLLDDVKAQLRDRA